MRNVKFALCTSLLLGSTTLIACASTPPQELISARDAYRRAAAGPAVKLAPAPLDEAKKSLDRAEQEFAEEGNCSSTADLAYIAERQVQVAEAKASIQNSQLQKENAKELATKALRDNLSKTREQLAMTKEESIATEQKLAVTEERSMSTAAQLEEEKKARAAAEEQARAAQEALEKVASVKNEERGMVISLSGSVLFATGQSALLPAASNALDNVATALKQGKPNQTIIIEGHTDNVGSDATNESLSLRRAQSVRNFLIARGVTAPIQAVGVGESRPIAENTNAEGRANNRRVEIIVAPGTEERAAAQ